MTDEKPDVGPNQNSGEQPTTTHHRRRKTNHDRPPDDGLPEPMTPELTVWCLRNRYIYAAMVPHEPDRVVFLGPTLTGGTIGVGGLLEHEGVSDRYSYVDVPTALLAFEEWSRRQFKGEPDQWIRHQPSYRRREYDNGTIVREWVAS